MKITFETKYDIGDKVAFYENEENVIPCPNCDGTGITLSFTNQIPCECLKCYGSKTITVWKRHITTAEITDINYSYFNGKRKIYYGYPKDNGGDNISEEDILSKL